MDKLIVLAILIAIGYGFYYYHTNQKDGQTVTESAIEIRDRAVATTNVGIDAIIKSAIQGIDKISPVYYYKNRSYGKSAVSNICTDSESDTSIGAIIANLEVYTKAVTCTVDPNFPTKSFTIVAPSFANKGSYYCTDQSGFVGLIPDIKTGTFKAGLACK